MKMTFPSVRRAAFLVILISALPLAGQAPDVEPEDSAAAREIARVLVLGTYHFANPGLDVVKTEVTDVFSSSRQAEIASVIEAVSRFRPTMIAVEQRPASAGRLDSLYQDFRAGRHDLSRNETQQLGFRLAARFEHPRVQPIDHPGEFPFEQVMEYAGAHDPDFADFVEEELVRIAEESNRQQREHTVGEILRIMNHPDSLASGHGLYLTIGGVGAGDTYVGADLLAKWYARNIHIHANLQQLAGPGQRILVIIGGGHAPILRELITYDPKMALVETLEYLPPPQQQPEQPNLGRFFEGREGTFVLSHPGTGDVVRHNPDRARARFLPASTFKIPNTLIALETGVAYGPDFPLSRDRTKAPREEWWPAVWSEDHTLRTALPNSVVWYYQELARRIGHDRMAAFVEQFGYGNQDISGGIDRFWLTGGIRISANEQVEFLKRFYFGELGVSERTTRIGRELLVLEETSEYRLSGKSGWAGLGLDGEPQTGWLVGYVEREDDVYFFATNLVIEENDDAAARLSITRSILSELGLVEH